MKISRGDGHPGGAEKPVGAVDQVESSMAGQPLPSGSPRRWKGWPGDRATRWWWRSVSSARGAGGGRPSSRSGRRPPYTQLLYRFPLSSHALAAKEDLALIQVEQGRAKEGYQALSGLFEKLPPDDQPAGASAAAEAAEAAHLWADAIRWRLEAASRYEGPAHDRHLARAVELLDGQLSFMEVAHLKEEPRRLMGSGTGLASCGPWVQDRSGGGSGPTSCDWLGGGRPSPCRRA